MSEAKPKTKKSTFDIVTVFLLSITAVLTAWCGFESSKWGGEMSIAFSQASSARVQAASAADIARDARQFDLAIYIEWVLAQADGRAELAAYIEERFSPEFQVAFDAWTDDGREDRGPFVRASTSRPEPWRPRSSTRAPTRISPLALVNNQRGDNYSLLTVLFALVLFLTAMSQRELAPWIRRVFLTLALVVGAVGVIILLTFPIKI